MGHFARFEMLVVVNADRGERFVRLYQEASLVIAFELEAGVATLG